jgi:4-hydroxy-tetrahydrodipicolinate reductase
MPQLESLIGSGYHIVSTCEELAYPQGLHPNLAERIDALAKAHGVAVLGTGVNPGYVFDTLILTATAVCQRVEHIRARRVLDAGKRRLPLQQKVGAGLPPDEFKRLVDAGKVRHVGLAESMRMVTDALGWIVERIDELTEAVIADSERTTPYLTVPAGMVAGVHQTGRAFAGGREVLHLDLQMYVGAADSYDEIEITGSPSVRLRLEGGAPGDASTAAMVINAVPAVLSAQPGLTSMRNLRLVHCWGQHG